LGFLSVEAINTQILNTREVLTLLREYMRDADSRGDTREAETFMERIKEKKKEYKELLREKRMYEDEYKTESEDVEDERKGLEALFGGEVEETMDPTTEKKIEPIIDDSVIGKLKASVDIPEEFKFADSMTFYTMLRNIFRNKYILVTGPSGCGKSSLGKILADITAKPFHQFNFGDTMNPAAKLLGDTKYNQEDGTWFKPSRFVSALQDNSGSFVMLDEVTRDRTGDLGNILMPVLDGQRYLALDESDDADVVTLDKNVFFFATANIGREYLGAANDLDRAWKDRFTGGIYELDYLPQKKEQELLSVRVPHVSENDARRITEFAKKIRDLYKAEELNVAVSTRMCLAVAELVVDGMNLLDALKHTVLPFYPITAGDDTDRVKVIQAIQSMGE
jgi:MoxR-like ATPase